MRLSFEDLKVWQIGLEYSDHCYDIAASMPSAERFNLAEQIRRAATSIGLNIAEGSIGRTPADQARYVGHAIGSLAETVGAFRLIQRRGYPLPDGRIDAALEIAEKLLAHLVAFRRALWQQARKRRRRSRPGEA